MEARPSIIVCGGRKYNNLDRVYSVLDKINPKFVVTGDATGADQLAVSWCKAHGVACAVFPAAWECYRKAAGPIRNLWMLQFTDVSLVVAFPGGNGTKNMCDIASDLGIEVRKIESDYFKSE